ncbi:MAG TPA: enoyl-CoA hydratase/isomerase family protein [Terriglobales bacterium]|nr:enoyl-CoA hydratase/isomerase family protein [Terriglobales bacterium]
MILTIDHGAVRELQLNRPPANALSPELIVALKQAVEAAPQDGARAIVLSGMPGRFSAGLDVPLLLTLERPAIATLWREFYALWGVLARSPIPIAAAITGHATAGGAVLPLFCDYRIAAQGDWKLGLNEVQVGLQLPPAIFSALKRLIGAHQAERLAVGGLLISPDEAARIGLVDEIVPLDKVVSRAIEWCRGLVALPVDAMAATRRRARADLFELFSASFDLELDQVNAIWWNPEAQTTLRVLVDRLARKKA